MVLGEGCRQIVQYHDCVQKKTLDIINCELLNGGDSYTYYKCLCQSNENLQTCYSLCSMDATLMLESQTNLQRIQTLCQQAQLYSTTSISSTATSTSTTSAKTVTKSVGPASSVTESTLTTTGASDTSNVVLMPPMNSGASARVVNGLSTLYVSGLCIIAVILRA